uniref:TLC domain-containing protein n=1 Tax=Angiostrongylus cantonensis TaxID=6313 RepID=A0A0K0CUM0_ANGCA
MADTSVFEDLIQCCPNIPSTFTVFDFTIHTLYVTVIAGSFLFFRILQYVVRWYLFGKCSFRAFSYFGISGRNQNSDSSRDLTVVPPNKKWRISNEAVSLIHSVASGLWAAYVLLFYKRLFEDLINERTQVALELVYVSFGYLLHDFFDLVLNEQSARIIELLFHHIVVITGFIVTLVGFSSIFSRLIISADIRCEEEINVLSSRCIAEHHYFGCVSSQCLLLSGLLGCGLYFVFFFCF